MFALYGGDTLAAAAKGKSGFTGLRQGCEDCVQWTAGKVSKKQTTTKKSGEVETQRRGEVEPMLCVCVTSTL